MDKKRADSSTTRDPDATRARLLGAGRDLFAARGFAGARTRAIAERAGVNAALIRYYFRDKQGLYSAVLVREIRRGRRRLLERLGDGGTAMERLGCLVDGFAELSAEQPELLFLLTREQMGGARNVEPEVLAELLGFFELTRSIVEEGAAAGELRDVDPHETHLSLVGSLVYFALTAPARAKYAAERGLSITDPTAEHYAEHVREIFLRGLRATPEAVEDSEKTTEIPKGEKP